MAVLKASTSLLLSLVLGSGLTMLTACTPPEPTESATPDPESVAPDPGPTTPDPESTTPDPESVAPAGEIVTLYIGPERVDCVGVAPQQCLLVRESTEIDYIYFYDTIEGFEYEPGYNYELLVEKSPVENPPADGSSIRWILVEVVDQVEAID